jgi:hypothetical protein
VVDRNPRCRAEIARLLREVGYDVSTTDVHTPAHAADFDAAEFVVVRRERDDFDDTSSIGDLEPSATDLVIAWLRPSGVVSRYCMAMQIKAANRQAGRILEAITPALGSGGTRSLIPGLHLLHSKIWGKSS